MKISVAMTTYNCEKYVIEQLESIFKQTRPVDELMICDDGSVDTTKTLVTEFIRSHNLQKSWFFHENVENKGCTRNFIECALMTTGDIVLYSDHDDIWDENKVELLEKGFIDNPDALLVAHRYVSVAEDGKTPVVSADRYFVNDNSVVKLPFSEAIHNMSIGGAVFAVKRALIADTALLSLEKGLSHDLPVGCVAAAKGGLFMVNTTLMSRRVHSGNLSMPTNGHPLKELRNSVYEKITSRAYTAKFYKEILDFVKDIISDNDKNNLKIASEVMERQALALEKRNPFKAMSDIFITNPMIDKTRILINIYCIIFGKYRRD